MNYRKLGKTGLMVSEIGLGGEWLERHSTEEVQAVIDECEKYGINVLDCWMCNPKVRSDIGDAMRNNNSREKWYIQGQFGSVWENGQYVRTRDINKVRIAFEDMLTRFHTDYIDLGLIHFVDSMQEWNDLQDSDFMRYVFEMKEKGVVKHLGLSTHNPLVALAAAKTGWIEMMLFSINPAFDMMAPSEDLDLIFGENAFVTAQDRIAPERAKLYQYCEEHDVGLTVMKGLFGGRLLDAKASPFGVALTPVQCIHYALTRPAVASVLVGYDTPEHVRAAMHYEEATAEEKDYASVLAKAPSHAFSGQCTYCGHCQPCPKGIDIALTSKYYDLATQQPTVPATVRAHYLAMPANASDCISCRACEKRCPFNVKIAERMKKAAELFR